jgi:CubicO group peptidase (beta-lactamase class C family)
MSALMLGGLISTFALWVGSLLQTWVSMRNLRGIVSDHLSGMILVIPAAPFTNRYAYLLLRIMFYPPWRRGDVATAVQQAQGWLWVTIGASAAFGTALAAGTGWAQWVWVVPAGSVPLVLWSCASFLFDDGDEMRDVLRTLKDRD